MDKPQESIESRIEKTNEKASNFWFKQSSHRSFVTFDASYEAAKFVASNLSNSPAAVFKIAKMTTRMFLGKSRGFVDDHDSDRPAESSLYRKSRHSEHAKTRYSEFETNQQPHSIKTLHLQNPYKAPQRLEGFASRNSNFKVRSRFFDQESHRSRDSNFRSRSNNLGIIKREVSTVKVHELGGDKKNRSQTKQRDICLFLKKLHLADFLKQYCSNSSLHGLRYIGDVSLSMVEKLFWFIAFVLAVLSAGYFIQHLYERWVESPIIISMSPEPIAFDQFPFPSVTVCNMNNVKKTEAIRINKGDSKLEKLLLEDQCDFHNTTISEDEFGSADWKNVLHFMINVSQPCTDMLSVCQWHGNVTDCETIFNPTMTDEGICCNFNSVHKKYLFFNASEWSDLNITFPRNSIDWNPETGYPESTPPDALPWRPYGAGKYFGLTLVLDSDLKEYYCSSTASVGFKMFLHNPVETPKIADFAFSLSPGRETRIIIKPQIATASWSILRVPKKKRKCFFTSERTLRYYRTYTQKNCLLECEANFTQKICKCVQYYMPKSSNTPICGKKDDLCATTARRAMEQNLYDEEIAVNQINITETENMAVVHLFFVDSQFPNYVKSELFGFIEFLSSIGGLLGLFMGFSFLSLAEIVYFVTLRVYCKRHGNHEKSSNSVEPTKSNRKIIYPFAQ
ncbi:pickpocket protein 28-like isoform X2 [Venturia canescens]|uniref:pickpocket protein 28-like isoform X2 n=1 Tax=Venturia canescens TaxID=32260 RepID=UPI001C9BC162|nr:pickpocket protein 28-like isoform X2 [Venturia canescens]